MPPLRWKHSAPKVNPQIRIHTDQNVHICLKVPAYEMLINAATGVHNGLATWALVSEDPVVPSEVTAELVEEGKKNIGDGSSKKEWRSTAIEVISANGQERKDVVASPASRGVKLR